MVKAAALALVLGIMPLTSRAGSDFSLEEKARAILGKNCHSCHGEMRMSGLDIRQRETLLKGGRGARQ